ncbi:extensin-like isoform X2 [Canna indica]|uniref:Extensin-like isoform X2 n=1 Tax=Canna indica TaxID=4628 RepID=A0AAQ3JTX3_9LILI|nr:extensin-like isoform X2 [Canna indica]
MLTPSDPSYSVDSPSSLPPHCVNPPLAPSPPPLLHHSPPQLPPSPPQYVPSPPVFLPPVVHPPPRAPPSPAEGTLPGLWCVAKPTVPYPTIQEAMDYACGAGADCDSIQPNGSCYQPDTLLAHASYAFNSYWQRTKVAGGTCDFGGTAMLITVDPSYGGCHFNLM